MATASINLASSSHSFCTAYDQRSNSSGTDFSTDLINPIAGAVHYDASIRRVSGFIFKISGMAGGSTIDSATLSLRTNNAWPSDTAQGKTYICVENNLDPLGTGAVSNGTLGSQPWQRLGRQSAATTLLGARCGPTHSGTLSSTGVTPRDSSAYIYRAWVTDANQATAGASGIGLPSGSWVTTCNFKLSLQALVNDPGWNSSEQYVLVWMFSEGQSGTEFNIGQLSGITWASGTVASNASYGNGGGQSYQNLTYAPKLDLTYTSTSLKSVSTASSSSGAVRFKPAKCWARWMGERAEYVSGGAFTPKAVAGARDIPPTGMAGVFNPNDALWGSSGNPPGARIKLGTKRPGREGYSLWAEDYASSTPSFWWDVNGHDSTIPELSVFSGRFYFRYERDAITTANPRVCTFQRWDGTAWVTSFWIETQAYIVDGAGDHFGEVRIAWNGGASSWTTHQFRPPSSNEFHRFEIQVDSGLTPKVRLRGYLGDSTTPLATVEASPPSVATGRLEFKDYQTDALVFFSFRVDDVEFYTDYVLKRQYPPSLTNTVGTPYTPQKITWFEWNGSSIVELEDLGDLSTESPVAIDATKKAEMETYSGEMWAGSTGAGNYLSGALDGHWSWMGQYLPYRSAQLIYPRGPMPANGFPWVYWNHGGFWVSGSYSPIPEQFLAQCLYRGIAVVSGQYIKTGLLHPLTWDPQTDGSGKYPTFILDYKAGVQYFQERARVTGTGDNFLDGSRCVATGHSAGGYNALGAVTSRGLANDGSGRSLRLSDNTSMGYPVPRLADPIFKGVYAFAGPINLEALKTRDPTHPNWPYLGYGQGIIRATAAMFMGLGPGSTGDTTNTGIDDFIRANPINQVHVGYEWGTADYLVPSQPTDPYSQAAMLQDAWSDVSATIPAGTTLTINENPDALHYTLEAADIDYERFFRWLKNVI